MTSIPTEKIQKTIELSEKALVSHAAVVLLLEYGHAIAVAHAYNQSVGVDLERSLFWHDVITTLDKIANAVEGKDI